MGEVIFGVMVAILIGAVLALILSIVFKWSVRNGRRTIMKIVGPVGILVSAGLIAAAMFSNLASDVGELLFFVCAALIVVFIGLTWFAFRETPDDEMLKMIADDL